MRLPSKRRTLVWGGLPAVLALAVVAWAAAQHLRPAPPTVLLAVRDSLGVKVVESRAPQWGSEQAWTLDPVPVLDRAESGMGEAHQFHRVADMLRTDDGTPGRQQRRDRASQDVRCDRTSVAELWRTWGRPRRVLELGGSRRPGGWAGDGLQLWSGHRARSGLWAGSGCRCACTAVPVPGFGPVHMGGRQSGAGRAARGVATRILGVDLAVSEREVARERELRLGPSPSTLVRRVVERLPDPATRPAYQRMLVDGEGNVWAGEFLGLVRRDAGQRWYVWDGDGAWLGMVEAPERFELFRVGTDETLGVWRDDNDVEHPQVLRLIKPAG